MQEKIENDYFKIYIDRQTEKQLIPKWLLQVSVRELHSSKEIPPDKGGKKYARDKKTIPSLVIQSYSTFFHTGSLLCYCVTTSCVGVSVAYL